MKETPHPPHWAEQFLGWYCRPELLEDLQGDLNEYFQRRCRESGPRRARFVYVLDVLKFIRPYTVRKLNFINTLIHWLMLGSYIKTSGRNILRHKLFSAINIIGLAISMSVGLLMIVFISDLLSYDDFHANRNEIYRLTTTDSQTGQPTISLASTSVIAGKQIQESITGIKDVVFMRNGFGGDAQVGDSYLPIDGLYASASFFEVFTFPLIQGNPDLALKEPYSLVLTEKTAIKLFGTTDALGKSVKFDTTNYLVTGVMKDIPKLSHLRFDALASFSTAEIKIAHEDPNFMSWTSIYSNYVYLLMPPNGRPDQVQAGLDRICKSENAGLANRNITLSLTPLKQIAVGAHHANEIGPTMVPAVLWILSGLAVVIILSACFNYTNLSIARSLRRSREVGIRKVIGANKGHVRSQFITESIIIALLALFLSLLLFFFLRVQFLSLNPHLEELVSLKVSPKIIGYFILFAVIVGMIAGFLPALFFSSVNPMKVLRDLSSMKAFRHVSMRRVLIVMQYTFSLIFITATVIGYDQYKSFLTFDLGFTTENVLNVNMQGNKGQLLRKELTAMPEVTDVSRSLFVSSLGSYQGSTVKYKNPQDSVMVGLNKIDDHYLTLHQYHFLAGSNFNANSINDDREVIVNEALIKQFEIGHQDPAKAIGEQLTMDGKKYTIVGVLKNFHYQTIQNSIGPVMFLYLTEPTGGYLNVKIASTDLVATLSKISSAWKKIDDIHPLDAKFYDDQIQEAYSQFSVMVKVIGFLAFLAVTIASMGMFGMVVYTTQTKLKEISIRKVFGATLGHLIYLLSRGFLFLMLLSGVIALPITYIFFDKVVLINFAYHQPIRIVDILWGMLAVLVIASVMICSQTIKAAGSNPANVLKAE